MLSKVLTGKDAERAQPVTFTLVPPRSFTPKPAEKADDEPKKAPPEDDEQQRLLRMEVQRLEGELQRAKQDSFELGRKEGEQRARAEIMLVIERMTASIADLAGMRRELRQRAEKDVVNLSLLIARRILHREVNVDANALTALARIVFERLARAESYQVTVHSQFAVAIKSALTGRLVSRVEIDPDDRCPAGTFIVRSEEGVIDASIDSQLDEISRGLTDRLSRA